MRNAILVASALGALVGLTGCQGLTAQQSVWLADGEHAYQEQQYSQAVQQLTRFVNDAAGKPELPRARYVRGLAYVRLNQRLAARTDLARVAETTADPDLRWRAYATLGTIDYEDGQWGNAARSLAAAVDTAPKSPPTDLIIYRLGLCFERSGRWSQSHAPFQRIASEYPSSKFADAARRRLEIQPDHFAIQCGVFTSSQNAGRLVSDLKRQGLSAYTRSESRPNGSVQVVLVGRCATYDEAQRELARVKGYVPEAILWP